MAIKRMFSIKVTGSKEFMSLPLSAQALYYGLCMHADDEGLTDIADRWTAFIGVGQKDLALLFERGFLLDVGGVTAIRHWRVNNTLRKERCEPTAFRAARERLTICEDGTYALIEEPAAAPEDPGRDAVTRSVTQSVTQVGDTGKEREGYLSQERGCGGEEISPAEEKNENAPVGKASGREGAELPKKRREELFETWWRAYPRKNDKANARKAYGKVLRAGTDPGVLLAAVEREKQTGQWQRDEGRFIPYPATWLNRGGWENEPIQPLTPDPAPAARTFDAGAYERELLAFAHGQEGAACE